MTRPSRELSRREYLAGSGAAALTGLAGCTGVLGSDGSDTLTVAYMPIYPDMQYFVMDQEGYFDELDASVEGKQFTDGPSIVKAYASGDIDVAMFGIVPAMIVVDRGIAAKVVAANIEEPMGILAHDRFAEMWDPNDPAGSFEQWRSETGERFTFGTFPEGSVPDILLRYWLVDEHDLEPGKHVDIVGAGGANAVFQGLANEEFDGTSIMEPVPTKIAANDLPYQFIDVAADFMPGQPAAVTLMADEVRDSDTAAAFVRQHRRATEFISSNRETAAEHASAVVGEQSLPVDVARQAMESPLSNFITDPREIESGTKIFAEYANRLGKTDSTLSAEQVFDYSVYDGLE
ncbi:ABC transporter substrate-binding protein [Haloprofundus sp. MHR1]|uniref:ABC transporter substrate-binding protein n=1 Tax=Haloprofundus sp. MHR1 TaxID=2572921 RepID=UPI0010BF27E6|nr:ABC transporter substrate-binding protein [Haloprofundus sp. MHR1]QCJ47477.1 ABC transporter substrate-binding protein [Haloprofundus sp. MHR1]